MPLVYSFASYGEAIKTLVVCSGYMKQLSKLQKGHIVGMLSAGTLGHLNILHNGINLNLVKGTVSDKVIPL